MRSFAVAAAFAGAASAAASGWAPQGTGAPVYVTDVVTAYTTYCPSATKLTHAGQTYTVTEATTLTITNCPCTVTYPASSVAAVKPTPVGSAPGSAKAPAGTAPPGGVSPPKGSGAAPGGTAPASGYAPGGTGKATAPVGTVKATGTAPPASYTGAAVANAPLTGFGLVAALGFAAAAL